MKKVVSGVCLLLVLGCMQKKDSATTEVCTESSKKNVEKYKMYEMSEMSALMEQMYANNQQLKQRIKQGDTLGKFPNHFLKIHNAVMTDVSENDAFFKTQAAIFIKAQELIYEDPKKGKQHFNEMVNACVQCHEHSCSGPISRIKKLYIP